MSGTERFHQAIARIDAANAADPNTETFEGRTVPKELLYGRRMSHWLEKLAPDASEVLRLAARAQHIQRWMTPRSSYPAGRAGYLQWRTAMGRFHAETAGAILREVGYDEPTIARVQSLLRKERLKADPEMQTLEDVICLVFLEHYFAEFAAEHDEPKLIGILRKTWRKMSPRGQSTALELQLPPEARALIEKALSSPDDPGAH